ncbi:DNA mismatch repair protein Msh2 [Copidosoma floridanum]|uniref:DNA mismatch repair protein Msh2 n=1 Tax=Copidosoma floridanum TaxID=29053 RepID=UPI0006C96FB1|nr:DNA mismatch repair protein Msh2 [Copidosoma floridanum]
MAAVVPTKQFDMDAGAQQSFVRCYKSLPEKPSSTIRFFNRADYYTLHGSDALFAAQEIFKSTAPCKKIGPEHSKIDGLLLNKNHFESFIKELLLVKQYRVEVYVNQGTQKNQDWVLEYKGSPGNLIQFEDILFGNTDIAVVAAVIAVRFANDGSSKVVGVSCIDTVKTLISVCEFKDDENFVDLEAVVVSLKPKECLLQGGETNPDFQTIKQLMERNNVLVTPRKKAEFSTDSLIQDLNLLIRFGKGQQRNAQALPLTNLKLAMSATASLITYLNLTGEGNENQYSLDEIERSRYVRLDTAAIKALNVEPRTESLSAYGAGSAHSSVLGILDKCRTPQGRRLLAQWIRQPLRDLALINERHDIVATLFDNSDLRTELGEEHLRRVPDLQQLAKKLGRKKAGLQECYKIYLCMMHLPQMVQKLYEISSVAAVKAMILDPLKEHLTEMDKFQQMVEQTIDLEAADKGEFMVKAEFDDELKELKEVMDTKEQKMYSQLNKAANDLDMEAGKSIKLEVHPQYGYHFRITLKEEKSIRNKNYIILDSIKGGVRFRSQKLEDLNDEYMTARNSYIAHQKTIVAEIVETAAGYIPPIKSLGNVIATLDVLNSFALAATCANYPYIRPKMLPSDDQELCLVQVRHPCLENQEGINYIANDVVFDKESRFLIVTGPNMGGKSTYIRSIGVSALMAHIGSFVPCQEATISLLDSILARIGADDSQIKGLSTFMAEMVETSAIIRMATANSLVIIDELGRGTSTYDGCGIAWSIAEHLAKEIKSYCLFATHFHEITRLAEDVPTAKNYHVTAIVSDKLTLLYKVKPGICDQSFGIHVAKMANFPEDVIEFARQKQAELEDQQGAVFEGSDDPEKKKEIIKEGEKLIHDFMDKCKSFNIDTLSEKEIEKKVSSLKKEVLNSKNPYIKALLGKS